MDGTGITELLLAVRLVQLDSEILASAGVFTFSATREDELPYFVNGIHETGRGNKSLTGRDRLRSVVLSMKAVAEEDGREAIEIAGELAGENYRLFGALEVDENGVEVPAQDGLTARERLNVKLEPLGWTAKMPLERGEIGPYEEHLDDLTRLHLGHRFKFTIEKLRV